MTAVAHKAGHVRPTWRWLLPAAVAIGVLIWLADFPVQRVPLGLGLLAAAALVAWRPVILFVLLPAGLALLDLAPWSGRRSLDEFDVLLAWGAAVAWARMPPQSSNPLPAATGTTLALVLVLLSLASATAHALWPFALPDLDDFSNPMSPFNALRLAKAGPEALALFLLSRRLRVAGADPTAAFGAGMVLGLAGTVIFVLFERVTFSHLLDFASDYRVAGPFSAMSLGGAYIECFLAVATPFLLVRLLPPLSPRRLLTGAALLAGASYALMVTYSRGGYLAMAIGVAVLIVVTLLAPRHRMQRAGVGVALAALAAAVAYPVLAGTFAQSRLKTVSTDLGTREQHWAESLQAMGDDALSRSFGMGLGRFAAVMAANGEPTGGHRLVTDGEGMTALRLGVGQAYFVDQIVPVQSGARYRVSYRVRPDGSGPAGLWVALCQKWIIASFECAGAAVSAIEQAPLAAAPGAWQTLTSSIVAPPDAALRRPPRPVRLSLLNEGGTPLDVDQLSLVGDDGVDLIQNGNFGAGLDHWTFTSDKHMAWQTKSLPLGVYFEQGLFGVVALAALFCAGAWHAMEGARRGKSEGAAFLAALCAFATVGSIDSLLNTPRFLLLWLLLCLLPTNLMPAIQRKPGGRARSELGRS